ncbi:hypothetical protein EDC56_1228 [Sinobacterium caligoides]|uniref:DUF469 family protein n=1 Tax=Sinobacterium caligoides TaxID=933926 RepID=A0A3N2E183_9GAMM|nr:YggL family protein [Sinobacterium caligoides]ROS05682.1 hypothetical protein EDC56_1228 [Sinobacterium caligoides]
MSNTQSRRLRKKLYLGEFAILGFEFSSQLSFNDEAGYDAFFDGLIALIDGRELMISGGGNKSHFEGFVTSNQRYGSTSEDDRNAVQAWLTAQECVSDIKVGELTDVYYGS